MGAGPKKEAAGSSLTSKAFLVVRRDLLGVGPKRGLCAASLRGLLKTRRMAPMTKNNEYFQETGRRQGRINLSRAWSKIIRRTTVLKDNLA